MGWKHYPQYLHIMHPEWESGGYHNNGVKKTEQKLKLWHIQDKVVDHFENPQNMGSMR